MIDTTAINQSFDLLAESERLTRLQKASSIEGGEWAGPCPMCGGTDRFRIQPNHNTPRWLCRQCTGGKWKDSISLVMQAHKLTFKDAVIHMGGSMPNVDPQEAARRAAERAERAQKELEESIARAQEALKELQEANRWVRYHETLEQNEQARGLWRQRGIPDVYQNLFSFGYDEQHAISTPQGNWITPTLTIPVFELGTRQCLNIRHRLLNPQRPGDKYRPERPGLPASLWIADPDLINPSRTLVVEGEIKAAVCYITADDPNMQVIGIPGKSTPRPFIAEQLDKNNPVYICYDPDARHEASNLALTVGDNARLVTLPDKIDDLILRHKLDKGWIRQTLRQATRL
jgi:hypothetical protein